MHSTIPEPVEAHDPWIGSDGSVCRTWEHGDLTLKGWHFATGDREAIARIHTTDKDARTEALAVADSVALTIEVPGDVASTVEVYLSPAQAVVLALQLAKAGTDAAVDHALAEVGIVEDQTL